MQCQWHTTVKILLTMFFIRQAKPTNENTYFNQLFFIDFFDSLPQKNNAYSFAPHGASQRNARWSLLFFRLFRHNLTLLMYLPIHSPYIYPQATVCLCFLTTTPTSLKPKPGSDWMDHGLDHRSDYGSDQEKALVHSSGHI